MNIHEHQAKALLARFGVTVPRGQAAFTPQEAEDAFTSLGAELCAIKSQIHAGGRGKGKVYDSSGKLVLDGGIKLARSAAEARSLADTLLGHTLVTRQTGPAGRPISRVYVETGSQIARELYLSIVIDRNTALPLLLASTAGGMDIEEVARDTPEKILRLHFSPSDGLWDYQARRVAYFLELSGPAFKGGVQLVRALARAFCELDCSMAEINPLVVTEEGQVLALDAKLNFDDNALYRQKNVESLRDLGEEDPNETEAKKYNLSYISLDGDIGCLVNGAGLAMASMDVIALHGRRPANFLDVGGSAGRENVTAAFKIILKDPKVKAILVNIFGGIMQCDIIAEGIIAAVKETQLKVPLVVRLEGTNVDLGQRMLAASGLPIQSARTLSDAARLAVAAAARPE